jgi:hypothetical protein
MRGTGVDDSCRATPQEVSTLSASDRTKYVAEKIFVFGMYI